MQSGYRILIADDHVIVRMGMVQVIKQLRPTAVLSEVEDYKELSTLISKEEFNLIILDVNMPKGTLQQAIDLIKRKLPNTKILVFSSQDEGLYAHRYLKMGADGFLNKLSSKEKIDQALKAILETGRFISEEVRDSLVTSSLNKTKSASLLDSLSDRELEVANKLVEGIPLKELSSQLNLHTSTISTYKNRVFEKLQIHSIPELIAILNLYN